MARAAIYARFSSDLQRDRSIDDQMNLCRDYAARNGYEIVATFDDRAVTGASIVLRAGIQRLLAAAKTGAFDFVIAESLSRIARDQEEGHAIRKRLGFHGVKIVTPADGVVSPLMHGLRTIIDSQYLEDLKGMIRRGMKGVVRDGRHAGGNPYGYRAVDGKPGEIVIDEAEAAVVARIFERFVMGDLPRQIAASLNADRVPPPRGAYWRASTIGGDTARQYGILRNRLYIGLTVWNRGHYVRDPETGRRVRRRNPESDWLVTETPHLRIIDDAVFEAAQRRLARRAPLESRRSRSKPRRLLSGLLRCGTCGGGMSIKDYDHGRPRLNCTSIREGGEAICDHRRIYYADEVERLVVDGLRDDLGSREAIGIFIRAYNDEKQRAASGTDTARLQLESRLASVDRAIERAVAAVIDDRITKEEADRHLPPLRAEREEIKHKLAELGQPVKVVTLRRSAVDTYLRDIENLSALVNGDLAEGDTGAAEALRALVQTVTIMPSPAGELPGLKVDGQLAGLLDLDSNGPYVGGEGGAGCPARTPPPTPQLAFTLLLGRLKAA